MKIENPTIVAALKKAAYIANLTPSEVLEYFVGQLVDDMENNPIDVLERLVRDFRRAKREDAETAGERLDEFAAGEHMEGRTQFTVACQAVETEDGFEVLIEHLHPKRGKWEPALPGKWKPSLPPPAGEDEDDNEGLADWWKKAQ
jgi:hypothetical protein